MDDDGGNNTKMVIDLDYHLGSGDGPGIVITPIKLRGAVNYDEWAKAIRRSMISKFKYGLLMVPFKNRRRM